MKENWTYKKVKEVCKKASSNIVLNKIEDNTGDFPLYGASGFVKGIDFYHRDEPYIGIVKDGSGVGRVDVYPAKSSLVGTMQYILPPKDCSLKFLCYALQGLNLSKFVNGAAIPHIYFRDYGECTIPVPPIETQSRIVSELDLLQSIIDKQKAQLKELDNLAQAVFYDMFGDPVENEKGWEVKKLEEVCDITSSKRIFADEYVEKGVPFYRSKEVIERSKGLPISVELFISEERYKDVKEKYGVPELGDILITAVGTIGKIWSVNTEDPFYFKDGNLVWLRKINKEIIDSTFFRASLVLLVEDYKEVNANGAAYNALTIIKLKEMQCILPPLPLQQSFATKIESIEKQKAAINQSIAETQRLFDHTMDKYFG